MKVVVLAPFADGTGYSKAAIENILAMDSVGITVVPRSVKMTNTSGEVPIRIKELEQNDLFNVDAVIQHNLPSEFIYKGGVRNIGAFAYETNGFPNTNWKHHLSLMDDIVVFCNDQCGNVIKTLGGKFLRKVHVIPHAVDTTKFHTDYKKIDFGLPSNCLKFYTIAEYGRRKNIPALLAAYFAKFSSNDNVALIIKTHASDRNQKSVIDNIKGIIEDLRTNMNRFSHIERYPKVLLITEYMSEKDICRLHYSCDVFVTASHGEAFCIPAIDALGFGKYIIAPKDGAFKDYTYDYGDLIKGVYSPVLGVNNAPQGLYSADELWFNINIDDLGEAMYVYYMKDDPCLPEDRSSYIEKTFSREAIGNKWKRLLENN